MSEKNTVLIPYDSFIVKEKGKFIQYNQHFAKKTADLFQDIITKSNDESIFKPLLLVGQKSARKEQVKKYLLLKYKGFIEEVSLKEAIEFNEDPVEWTALHKGTILDQKIKLIDVSYDFYATNQ